MEKVVLDFIVQPEQIEKNESNGSYYQQMLNEVHIGDIDSLKKILK